MSSVAILPIKRFDQAKQRLRDALGSATRQALVEAMFADVLVALRRTRLIEQVLVVTSDSVARRVAEGYGAVVVGDEDRGHNQAAAQGIARALVLGAERALLVPGDCPLLDPAELDALIETAIEHPSAIVIPDRHGSGTNALLLSPPNALGPAFGPLSRARHEQKAEAAGLTVRTMPIRSLALDLDTPEDLAELVAALKTVRGGAAHTRGLVRQLARVQESR